MTFASVNSVPIEMGNIWGEQEVEHRLPRLFISHKSENKLFAKEISKELGRHGFASFVAHDDIKPSMKWLSAIEFALGTMDGLLALLTPNFRVSEWTDQEIGFAVCRQVPLISVRLGMDPYGFMGENQAVLEGGKEPGDLAKEIAETFFRIKNPNVDGELRINAYLWRLRRAGSFATANSLFEILSEFENLSAEHERRLVDIFNTNSQVNRSFEFDGGVVCELKRMTGHAYEITSQRQLIPDPKWGDLLRSLRNAGSRFKMGALLRSAKGYELDAANGRLVVKFAHNSHIDRIMDEMDNPAVAEQVSEAISQTMNGEYELVLGLANQSITNSGE